MDINQINKTPKKFGDTSAPIGPYNLDMSAEVLYQSTIKVKQLLKTQWMIIGSMAVITAASVTGFIYKSSVNPYVPYAVRISENGAINGQVLNQGGVTADDKIIEFFLVDFIKKTRTVYKDVNFYNKQVADKMAFITPSTKSKFEEFIKTRTDTAKVLETQSSISVEIDSFVKIDIKKYQINYTEKTFSADGKLIKESKYTMVAFIDYIPVTTDAMVRMNPLGIVIRDAEFALISSVSSTPTQAPAATLQPQTQTVPQDQSPVQVQTVPQQ